MTIQDILNADLSDTLKVKMMQIFTEEPPKILMHQEGGNIDLPRMDITIGNKTYNVRIAKTDAEKEEGLSKAKSLPANEGMLFVYEEPQPAVLYTMADTSIDLDIIFIDEEGTVLSVKHCFSHSKQPIIELDVQFVLEVNINSGIRPGDELEDYNDEIDYQKEGGPVSDKEDSDELTDDDKQVIAKSKMLVLDENGDVQMRLEGGERIFSRISTKKFIKAAIKAYRSDAKPDYIKVGKLVFNELNAQDGRDPQYVEAPK